jgi:hypothetical protein
MSHENTPKHQPEKGSEGHRGQEKLDKHLEGAQIVTKTDNDKQDKIKKTDALRAFRFTSDGQSAFTIVDEMKREVVDKRALRKTDNTANQTVSQAIDQAVVRQDTTRASLNQDVIQAALNQDIAQVTPTPDISRITLTKNEIDQLEVKQGADRTSPAQIAEKTEKIERQGLRAGDAGASEHPWEERRRQQLVDRYMQVNHLTEEQAKKNAEEDIQATKKVVEKQVHDFEAHKQKELESEYIKQGKIPQEAHDLAQHDVEKSRKQTEERVERFEVEKRQQLENSFIKQGLPPDRAIVEAENSIRRTHEQTAQDVAQFETARREQLDHLYRAQGMTPEKAKAEADKEINETYIHLDYLIQTKCEWNADGKPGLDAGQKIRLSEDVMHQVAHPTEINQGHHNTCNAATIETCTTTRHPSETAGLVAEVATTGKYTVKGPPIHKVELPTENLTYHGAAEVGYPADARRSYASQIFQTTAVNLYYIEHKSLIRYLQTDDSSGKGDTGERLEDRSKHPPKPYKTHAPGVMAVPGHMLDVQHFITGEQGMLLTSQNRPTDAKSAVVHIHSEEDLKKALEDAKKHGKFPITIEVSSNTEPFRSDGGGPNGVPHAVTICGYDDSEPKNPKIYVDNQWGAGPDHLAGMDAEHRDGQAPLSLHQMWQATRKPIVNDSEDAAKLDHDVSTHKFKSRVEFETELRQLIVRVNHDWATYTPAEKLRIHGLITHLQTF